MVIELQVLQPHQFLRPGEKLGQPRLADLGGRVYFDDVTVWQRPSIEMTTESPGNVIRDLHIHEDRRGDEDRDAIPLQSTARVMSLENRA